MRTKRIIAMVLTLVILGGIGGVFPTAIAGGFDYDIRMLGRVDSSVKYNGRDTYTIDAQVKTNNGAVIDITWDFEVAYDTSVFEMVTTAGTQNFSEAGITVTPGAAYLGIPPARGFSTTFSIYWPPKLFVAISADGKTGFISMQAETPTNDPTPLLTLTTLQSVRLAFKPGKTLVDVTKDSVRLVTRAELPSLTGVSCAILLTDGTNYYEYLTQSDSPNTLSTPDLDFEYNGITQYTITATAGTGGTVSGGGTYDSGDNVALTATPNSGYSFDGWYESNVKVAGAGESYTFTVNANRTLEARFVVLGPSTVTITATAGSGGTVSGGGTVNTGSSVTVAATPDTGYVFEGWYESNVKVNGAGANYTFNANADRTLEARFIVPVTYTITATASSNGTVTGGGTYIEGTNITLAAKADQGYRFDGWYESDEKVNGAGLSYNFTVNADRTLEARFVESADIIVFSTSHPTAYINLTKEEIFIPSDITVAAYSVNAGVKWKKGALPMGAKLSKLFNKEMTIFIAQELDTKKKPAGIFVKFPAIKARPKANEEKLAPWYGADTWDLTKKKTSTLPTKIYEWTKSTNGKTADAGEEWMRVDGGKCGITIEKPRVKTTYLFRTPASGDGSTADPYTPASKAFKVKPRPQAKVPNYKVDTKKNSIKLKNDDWYIIGDGAIHQSSGSPLELKNIPSGTKIFIWKGHTGVKPPSAVFERTV